MTISKDTKQLALECMNYFKNDAYLRLNHGEEKGIEDARLDLKRLVDAILEIEGL